jgi:hypothetical protein
VLVRLLKRQAPRLWLLFGLIMGIGPLITPARRSFHSWGIYAGGAIAFAFLTPYALWNAVNGWPTLEFWAHYGGLRLVHQWTPPYAPTVLPAK